MWRMVCFVDNCQVTPRHFGTGQGAMTLAHSLTNLVDFDTLCKWPFDFLQMFCFSIQAAMKNQMILLLNFGIYIRVRFFFITYNKHFATLWSMQSMEFTRPEYWSG